MSAPILVSSSGSTSASIHSGCRRATRLVAALLLAGCVKYAGGASAAVAARPALPPPGAIVLAPGPDYALEGTFLLCRSGAATRVMLHELSRKVVVREIVSRDVLRWEHAAARSPARFSYRTLSAVPLTSSRWADLEAVARSVGDSDRVRISGRWTPVAGSSLHRRLSGLDVTGISIRGHELPDQVPSRARLFALARAALAHLIATTHLWTSGAEPVLLDLGGLQVWIGIALARHPGVPPSWTALIYEALSGEIRPLRPGK
jgi:hypothetical protein